MPAQRIVLAEYFATEESTLLFIVRADFDEPYVVEIERPLREIQQFVVDRFREERDADGHLLRSTSDKVSELDVPEYQAFFQPFVDPLAAPSPKGDMMTNPDDIIWFVPHDVLHYLPLHALALDGHYLIERNPVCYTPSASVMKYCQAKRTGRRERALIFADSRPALPLLHAREQSAAIKALFNPATEVYVGQAATKTMLKQRLEEAKDEIDVLHLACHGYFHPYQALKSGIMLASEDEQQADQAPVSELAIKESPWNLSAEEIFSLEMNVDLVTLSACESGINDRRPGDELIGLTRALIYAGTPSVLVSLWSVEDLSTSLLMREFYQSLRAGHSKAQALRQAQRYVQSLSAEEAIAICNEVRTRFTEEADAWGRELVDEDIARLRYLAGDFAGARDDYQALKQRLPRPSPKYQEIATRVFQCEMAARAGKPINYQHTVYAHPFYWSAFVLIGDWK